VHLDSGSGKHTLLGVFSSIVARQFPVVHASMVWFITLGDLAAGTHRLRVLMGLDPTNPAELFHREFESQGPLQRINLINELRHTRFERAGDYSILIEVDDEPLLAASLPVTASP
jgi:hypothetical protein